MEEDVIRDEIEMMENKCSRQASCSKTKCGLLGNLVNNVIVFLPYHLESFTFHVHWWSITSSIQLALASLPVHKLLSCFQSSFCPLPRSGNAWEILLHAARAQSLSTD